MFAYKKQIGLGIIAACIVVISSALTVRADTVWKGPSSIPFQPVGLTAILNVDDLVSILATGIQNIEGGVSTADSETFPAFLGYQTSTEPRIGAAGIGIDAAGPGYEPDLTSDSFRVTEYPITGSAFSGTTYELTLDQDLAQHHIILVRGGADGGVKHGPDENYARVDQLPSGIGGEVAASSGADVIRLKRQGSSYNWIGVVTVIEALGDFSASSFYVRDIVEVYMENTDDAGYQTGTDTSGVTWDDINQVVLFGGGFGGGVESQAGLEDLGYPPETDAQSAWSRYYPSGSNTINWSRFNGNSRGLEKATSTVYVVEFGSEWDIQHVEFLCTYCSNIPGGDGADETSEYATESISQVNRDETWVWGTGTSAGEASGYGSEGKLITLGDGVNQNDTETTVAMGAETVNRANFDVYVMSHPSLSVDYRFKVDGNSADYIVDVPVDTTTGTERMSWVTPGSQAGGWQSPSMHMFSRYIDDSTVRVERPYTANLSWPAWVTAIDFSNISHADLGGTVADLRVGVYGLGQGGAKNYGIYAVTDDGIAVAGRADDPGGYGGYFVGDVSIDDNLEGTADGTLDISGTLTTRGAVTANIASGPAIDFDATSAVSGPILYGVSNSVFGGDGIGVYGFSTDAAGISLSATDETSALDALSLDSYGIYGYSASGPGVRGEVDNSHSNAEGIFGQAADQALSGRASYTLSGSEWVVGTPYGSAVSQEAGIGVYACGSVYAGYFDGDLHVANSINMGLASETYVENTDASDTIIDRLVTPESTLTQDVLVSIVAQCVLDGDCSLILNPK